MRDYQKISEYKLTLLVFRQYSKENVKLLKTEIKSINEKTKWKIKRIRYYGYQIKKERKEGKNKMKEGMKVIVRGDRSGVFYGEFVKREGREVQLKNCRRLWYWNGANSISELAEKGTQEPNNCKFTVVVENIEILDAIEIIECTNRAIKSIEGVKVWKY